jgi:hypothetical protein
MDVDTLGATPRREGTLPGLKVSKREGKSTTRDIGDSTEYSEYWDRKVDYMSLKVPITSLVREDIENSFQQRKWQIGRSADAPPMRYIQRSVGEARLVDYGSGMKSKVLTEAMQKSLGRGSAQKTAPGSKPKPKPGAAKKSG